MKLLLHKWEHRQTKGRLLAEIVAAITTRTKHDNCTE